MSNLSFFILLWMLCLNLIIRKMSVNLIGTWLNRKRFHATPMELFFFMGVIFWRNFLLVIFRVFVSDLYPKFVTWKSFHVIFSIGLHFGLCYSGSYLCLTPLHQFRVTCFSSLSNHVFKCFNSEKCGRWFLLISQRILFSNQCCMSFSLEVLYISYR